MADETISVRANATPVVCSALPPDDTVHVIMRVALIPNKPTVTTALRRLTALFARSDDGLAGAETKHQEMSIPRCASFPDVSVVMATYNGAQFVSEQLASIAAQTLQPAELVVSDDGSSDDTLAIIAAFAKTISFPVCVLDKHERLGFSDNFLFAAEQCHGPLVAFVDQDDVWLPNKLEIGVGRLCVDDSLMSLHQLTMTDDALRPTTLWDQGIVRDKVWGPLELDPWSGWGNTMVFRRELIAMIPRADRPRHPEASHPLSHDTWLYILAAAMGRVSHIALPLILYRQHADNVFGMAMPDLRKRWQILTTVPIDGYRERQRFLDDLSRLFDTLAHRATGKDRQRAFDAARFYHRQSELSAVRVEIHLGPDILTRFKAWNRLHRQRHDKGASGSDRRRRSALKDFMLGVTGWGRHA